MPPESTELPAPFRIKTHPDCRGCCARGACHFCAGTAAAAYSAGHRGHTYFACAAHRAALADAMRTDPRSPRPAARVFPLSPLPS